MEQNTLLTLKPQLGAYIFSLLFLFTGVVSVRGEWLGSPILNKKTPAEKVINEMEVVAAPLALSPEAIAANLADPREAQPIPAYAVDTETLWLARCIFSETKRPEEQELVAWVIRNRVETQYRGQSTYRDVVLDPYQFSAFIPGTRTRTYYTTLNSHSKVPGWQRALRIAYEVKRMPDTLRPFSPETRHFYSEQSMKGQRHPAWSKGRAPVAPKRIFVLEEKRFRFYASIS